MTPNSIHRARRGAVALSLLILYGCGGGGGGSSSSPVGGGGTSGPPSINFAVSPDRITEGTSATLTWAATSADTCTASGAWSGQKPVAGSEAVAPPAGSYLYTLTCTGAGGQSSLTESLVVDPVGPTLSLAVTPSAVLEGQSATIAWTSQGTTSCTASGDWSGSRATTGSESVSLSAGDYSFTLSCSGAGGQVQETATLVVSDLAAVNLEADPQVVQSGGTTTLRWSSVGVDGCTAGGGWSGPRAASGSEQVGPLGNDTVFTLDCSGSGGDASDSVQVTVTAPPDPASVTLSANPDEVEEGQNTTLTWSSVSVDSCTATGGWSGAKAAQGSQQVGPLQADTQFGLDCSGPGGNASDTVLVRVTPAPGPAAVTLTADPAQVFEGQTSRLTWSGTGVDDCTASGDWSGSRGASGTEVVGPLTTDSTFVLDCSGPGGDASDSVTVDVTPVTGGGLSGSVDSSYVRRLGDPAVYVYEGSVTPDDIDGDSGDPVTVIDIEQDEGACTFAYDLPAIGEGDYTLAVVRDASGDGAGSDDTLDFAATTQLTIGSGGAVNDFVRDDIIRVGPTRALTTMVAAEDVAGDGDVIEIDPGTYVDDIVVWRQDDLTLRGVGGRPHMQATQVITFQGGNDQKNGKGIWVTRGNRIVVENVEFSGARVTDENGAGIRGEGNNLTVCNSYFHDNENGMLTDGDGTLLIEYSEFDNNGLGEFGRTHNLYVVDGATDRVIFRHSLSRRANIGHQIKSRAQETWVLYSRLMDEDDGTSSYAVDVPNGGLTVLIGNLLQQGPNTDNSSIVNYGSEGFGGGRERSIYAVNNTMVNDLGNGRFFQLAGGTNTKLFINNIFLGGGATPNDADEVTNLETSDAGLVDRANFDYRLQATSPARNAGTDPGTIDGIDMTPVWQYVDIGRRESRPTDGSIDIGAYEYEP